MKQWVVAVLFLALNAGCSIGINAPLLPNVKLGDLPSVGGLTDEGESSTRAHIANLTIGASVINGTGFSASTNCVQLVENQSTSSVVLDYSSEACPPAPILSHPNSVVVTGSYQRISGSTYELKLKRDDGDWIAVGRMAVDVSAGTVSLTDLCSGTYRTACFLNQSGGVLQSIHIY